jgi:Rod binding domain-containing protein
VSDLAITGDGGLQKGDTRERLRAVANQLEGVFLNQLLAKLDDSSLGDDDEPLLGGSSASKQFSQLFHQALGEKAAGSLGLADVIFQQLAGRLAVDRAAQAKEGKP